MGICITLSLCSLITFCIPSLPFSCKSSEIFLAKVCRCTYVIIISACHNGILVFLTLFNQAIDQFWRYIVLVAVHKYSTIQIISIKRLKPAAYRSGYAIIKIPVIYHTHRE